MMFGFWVCAVCAAAVAMGSPEKASATVQTMDHRVDPMPFIVVQMGGFECTLVLLHMIARGFSFLPLDFLPLSID
jgi:hypothetical protein